MGFWDGRSYELKRLTGIPLVPIQHDYMVVFEIQNRTDPIRHCHLSMFVRGPGITKADLEASAKEEERHVTNLVVYPVNVIKLDDPSH